MKVEANGVAPMANGVASASEEVDEMTTFSSSFSDKSGGKVAAKGQASDNLLWNLLTLFFSLTKHDYVTFMKKHDTYFQMAKRTGDYAAVTANFYSVMAEVVEKGFGGSFHFVPPSHAGQTKREAEQTLHQTIARCLNLTAGKVCIDIGCGIGTTLIDVAKYAGAKVIGLTVAPDEVKRGAELTREKGAAFNCEVRYGDCMKPLEFESKSLDAAYAVYALKYFPDLTPIFSELGRVLKPNGLFLIYDLVKTDDYDPSNAKHRAVVEGVEYATGMPSLHTISEMVEKARSSGGLELVSDFDLAVDPARLPWYHFFVRNPLFMWALRSPATRLLLKAAVFLGVLPEGFVPFFETFLAGNVDKLVRAGQLDVLSGSRVLVFRRTDNDRH